MFNDNKVTRYAADLRANPKLGDLEESALDITFREHYQMQEWQARAHAAGILTSSEAQTIYRALGAVWTESNGGWGRGTDKAMKTTVTLLMEELGRALIKVRQVA